VDEATEKNLLLEEIKAELSILDSKQVVFTLPVSEEKLPSLSISDLKRLHRVVRDLARTPTGNQ
jgi:hypothetical protein